MPSPPEPISWLTLERYALGELSSEERAEVEARLALSETDRACLAEILADKTELPALPEMAPTRPMRVLSGAPATPRKTPWLAFSGALCAAAVTLLLVLRDESRQRSAPITGYDGVKGADVALRLISERQGSDPASFSAGERFKIEVTCPPKLSGALRLLVVQAGEVFEPLPRAATFACGNRVPWPGAFALDGSDPAEVCLYWGAAQKPSAQELAQQGSCSRLEAR